MEKMIEEVLFLRRGNKFGEFFPQESKKSEKMWSNMFLSFLQPCVLEGFEPVTFGSYYVWASLLLPSLHLTFYSLTLSLSLTHTLRHFLTFSSFISPISNSLFSEILLKVKKVKDYSQRDHVMLNRRYFKESDKELLLLRPPFMCDNEPRTLFNKSFQRK